MRCPGPDTAGTAEWPGTEISYVSIATVTIATPEWLLMDHDWCQSHFNISHGTTWTESQLPDLTDRDWPMQSTPAAAWTGGPARSRPGFTFAEEKGEPNRLTKSLMGAMDIHLCTSIIVYYSCLFPTLICSSAAVTGLGRDCSAAAQMTDWLTDWPGWRRAGPAPKVSDVRLSVMIR